MARRKYHEEHENHERWLVSYADFITLLFAFFVVMYALSSVNEGKYKVLSDSLVSAFRAAPENTRGASTVRAPIGQAIQLPMPVKKNPNYEAEEQKRKAEARKKALREKMADALSRLVAEGVVRITDTERGVAVEINSSVLFATGQALIQLPAADALRAIGNIVATTEYSVLVEGHTDNAPINTPQFPSNWELSAVRATTVLRLFIESGVLPQRLTAIGYGELRPIESNETVEGRARNRRVVVLIETEPLDANQRATLPAPAPARP